jgi:hypothetical protein
MSRVYTPFERGVIASLAWQIKGWRDGYVPEDATRRVLRASLRRISPVFRGRSLRVTEDTPTHIDHSIPVSVVATILMASSDISVGRITNLLERYLRSAEITEEEHRVVLRDYHSTMPPDWDPACTDDDNDLARYKKVGIVLIQPPPILTVGGVEPGNKSVSRERFPMRMFREYAKRHELDDDVLHIDQLAETLPDSQRERKPTFRRGLAIELLEQENLLESFLHEVWPYGLTAPGRSEMRKCKNFARRWQE